MPNFYCKFCGTKFSSVTSLTGGACFRHPDGAHRGKHALYEGSEKSKYTCKFCGSTNSSISGLTGGSCLKHPSGAPVFDYVKSLPGWAVEDEKSYEQRGFGYCLVRRDSAAPMHVLKIHHPSMPNFRPYSAETQRIISDFLLLV